MLFLVNFQKKHLDCNVRLATNRFSFLQVSRFLQNLQSQEGQGCAYGRWLATTSDKKAMHKRDQEVNKTTDPPTTRKQCCQDFCIVSNSSSTNNQSGLRIKRFTPVRKVDPYSTCYTGITTNSNEFQWVYNETKLFGFLLVFCLLWTVRFVYKDRIHNHVLGKLFASWDVFSDLL